MLKILCQADVTRATNYSSKKINELLAADIVDNTPGARFPLPLRPLPGQVVGNGVRREWAASDLYAWIEKRRQK